MEYKIFCVLCIGKLSKSFKRPILLEKSTFQQQLSTATSSIRKFVSLLLKQKFQQTNIRSYNFQKNRPIGFLLNMATLMLNYLPLKHPNHCKLLSMFCQYLSMFTNVYQTFNNVLPMHCLLYWSWSIFYTQILDIVTHWLKHISMLINYCYLNSHLIMTNILLVAYVSLKY